MFSFLSKIWKSNWRNKTMLLGGAAILLAAIVGVIYGVATSEGDEGFLVRSGHELKWNRSELPLSCMYDPQTVKPPHLASYNSARRAFNQRTGMQLIGPCVPWRLIKAMPEHVSGAITLRVGARLAAAVDGVEISSPFDAHFGGTTSLLWDKRDGHLLSISIRIDPTFEGGTNPRVWIHELGHSLGLDHDRLKDSVMYRHTIIGRPREPSAKDVKLLQRAYKQ